MWKHSQTQKVKQSWKYISIQHCYQPDVSCTAKVQTHKRGKATKKREQQPFATSNVSFETIYTTSQINKTPSIREHNPKSLQRREEHMHFSKVSLLQSQSWIRHTRFLQLQTIRDYHEQSSVRRAISQGSSMRRDESEHSYTTDVNNCLVDQNILQTGKRPLIKFFVPWYVYSPKADTIKQSEDNPRQ